MPLTAGTYGAGVYGAGPYGMAAATPTPPGNLAQPVAEYVLRVRNSAYQIVGEISQYHSAGFTLRHNNVSAWMVEIDANDPLADDIAADGAGIQVVRILRDPATGQRLSGGVLFSGPRWGRVRQMQGRTLIASGYDDLLWLQGRLAYPVTSLPYSATILADTPLRYYRLGEAAGTTATDSSGNARHGTYVNNPTKGVPGGIDDADTAVTFAAASSQRVSVPTTGLPTGNNPWTLECWFNVATLPGLSQDLVAMGTAGTRQMARIVINGSGVLASTFSGDTAATAFTAGAWHHVCATWDGTTLTCYLDGAVAKTATPGAVNLAYGAAMLAIRADLPVSGYFNGSLDEVAIYNTALSLARIQQHYSVGLSRFASGAYDVRTGAAETVIRQYVDVNAVSASVNPLGQPRIVPGLTLAPDSARGSTVTGNARFNQLVLPDGTGLLQQLAQSGGLGIQVVQSGTSLVFQQYQPTDRTASVIFSEALGNLANYTYQEDGPDFSQGGNAILVGGGGQGTARVLITRMDSASVARWGLFEGFQDGRDTTDVPTLQQRGDSTLAQSAVSTQFACTLAPQRAIVYGQDFNVGDSVTIVIDGVSMSNIVREVQITLDSNGAETVVPAIGTPNADTIRQLFGGFVQQRQLTALNSTANTLARSQ